MSSKGNLEVTKSPELSDKEDGCSCIKVFFGVFCTLCWLVSIGILGLTAWQAAGASSFLGGTAVFSYGLLTVSITGFLACILGFLGLIMEHLQLTGAYLMLITLMIFTEVGLILGCYVLYPTADAVIAQMWTEANPFIKEATQTQLKCCGLVTWNDTYDSLSSVPQACVVLDNGCSDAIISYFESAAVLPSFITVLLLPAIIQLLACTSGGIFFHVLRKQVSEAITGSRRARSKNTIVPIMVTPKLTPTLTPKTTPKMTPKMTPKVTRTSPTAKSAASRGDVNLDVGSPQREKTKGNEALFKVATVMLEE